MLEFPLSCLFSVVKINLEWILQKKRTPQVPLGQPAKVRERRLSKKSIVYWPYIPGCWERYHPCMMLFQKWHAGPSKDVNLWNLQSPGMLQKLWADHELDVIHFFLHLHSLKLTYIDPKMVVSNSNLFFPGSIFRWDALAKIKTGHSCWGAGWLQRQRALWDATSKGINLNPTFIMV